MCKTKIIAGAVSDTVVDLRIREYLTADKMKTRLYRFFLN